MLSDPAFDMDETPEPVTRWNVGERFQDALSEAATPEQLTKAWGRWIASPRPTASMLATCLVQVGVVGTSKYWPTARVADRMLQRARKAEAIRFERNHWIVNGGDHG